MPALKLQVQTPELAYVEPVGRPKEMKYYNEPVRGKPAPVYSGYWQPMERIEAPPSFGVPIAPDAPDAPVAPPAPTWNTVIAAPIKAIAKPVKMVVRPAAFSMSQITNPPPLRHITAADRKAPPPTGLAGILARGVILRRPAIAANDEDDDDEFNAGGGGQVYYWRQPPPPMTGGYRRPPPHHHWMMHHGPPPPPHVGGNVFYHHVNHRHPPYYHY